MAKTIYDEIAEWLTEYGLEGTTNGSYYVAFVQVAEAFKVSPEWVKEHAEDIENSFDYDVVTDCEIEDDSFGMNFYLQYCCEHCGTYIDGNRCSERCSSCDCWCEGQM